MIIYLKFVVISIKADTIQSRICNPYMEFTDEEISHNTYKIFLRTRKRSFTLMDPSVLDGDAGGVLHYVTVMSSV
jgi:hypothetical protein